MCASYSMAQAVACSLQGVGAPGGRWSCWVRENRARCGARSPLMRIAACDRRAGPWLRGAHQNRSREDRGGCLFDHVLPARPLSPRYHPEATSRLGAPYADALFSARRMRLSTSQQSAATYNKERGAPQCGGAGGEGGGVIQSLRTHTCWWEARHGRGGNSGSMKGRGLRL